MNDKLLDKYYHNAGVTLYPIFDYMIITIIEQYTPISKS